MNEQMLKDSSVDGLESRIDALDRKLERVLDELEEQRRRRMALDDLEADVMRVGNEVFKGMMTGLQEYEDSINRQEMWKLFWNFVRNIEYMNKVMERTESGLAFLEDASPIARQMMLDFTAQLYEWQKKGYLDLFKAFMEQFNRIAQSLEADDVRKTGDQIERMITALNQTEYPDEEEATFGRLFKEIRSPEFKRSMVYLLTILKTWFRQPMQPELNRTINESN